MAGVRKEDFEEELREEGRREVIPAEERRSYERGREEGDSTVAPVAIRVPSTLDVRPRAARLPRVELPRGMRISIVLRQKGKVRLHAQ